MSASSEKLRILYCGSVVPVRTWHGGSPLLWRHFSALPATMKIHCFLPHYALGSGVESEFACSFAPPEPTWLKFRRFSSKSFVVLTHIWLRELEESLERIISDFQPDILLGIWVPDDFLWLGGRVASKNQIPRSLFMHDVHAVGNFLRASKQAEKWTWAQMDSASQLLTVSQGMMELCGKRSKANLRLLYPVPEQMRTTHLKPSQNGKLRMTYFGSVQQGYDKPFVALARGLDSVRWDLSVTWLGDKEVRPQIEEHFPTKDLGWLQISHLPTLAVDTDIFLVLQSFDEKDRVTTSVNFQSKFTQIAQFGKAVLVIAPPWSSIAKWACEKRTTSDSTGVIELVETCDVEDIRNAVQRLEEATHRRSLGVNLLTAYEQDFHPTHLQNIFEKSLQDISLS